MRCKIRGEKIEVTGAIKDYIENKLSRLDKYFKSEEVDANVLISLKGKKQSIEVTVPYDKFTLRSEEGHDDLYAAIDLVIDKLEGQIRKSKTKLKRQIKRSEDFFNFDYDVVELVEDDNKIVKRKKFEMKPMSEEEAMLELELVGHDFYVYKDDKTNVVSVIYKRKDGNFGIIETDN